MDVFTAATGILKQNSKYHEDYKVIFSAEKTGLVQLNSGLQLYSDITIGKGKPTDIFIVPGGVSVDQVTQNTELINRVCSKAKKSKQIVSVCSGAFILAACGLLNGKKATTHWSVANDLAKLYPDINVNPDAIYVRDGNIYTSTGVTAGIDLALALVEEHLGSTVAMEVARMLVLYFRRPGGAVTIQCSTGITCQSRKSI